MMIGSSRSIRDGASGRALLIGVALLVGLGCVEDGTGVYQGMDLALVNALREPRE